MMKIDWRNLSKEPVIDLEADDIKSRLIEKALQVLRYENLTWKCEVCRRERHDSKIDVISHPFNLEGIKGHQNIKYCNDSPHCEEMARTHDLFELKRLAKENR